MALRVPVLADANLTLMHTPGLVRHGSKPARELDGDAALAGRLRGALRDFEAAVAYPPNQVFIGNAAPAALWDVTGPWYGTGSGALGAERFGRFGEVMPEEEFLGLMALADVLQLVHLDGDFADDAAARLQQHPLLKDWDALERLSGVGSEAVQRVTQRQLRAALDRGSAVALTLRDGGVVGSVRRDHDSDEALQAPVLLENLASKASAFLALAQLFGGVGTERARSVPYLLGCGEEGVGDRYQRAAGGLARAAAEMAGCARATGSDTKAACCAPVHSMVEASALVASGVFDEVVVVGGGSLPKLGMKLLGHLKHDMPILEDVLAAVAFRVAADDGRSPLLRLDAVGRYPIEASSTPGAVMAALVKEPLERVGLGLGDVDRFATELHNPEITEPAGSGNVPRTNYRMIASLGVLAGEWGREVIDTFGRERGLPGYSPTQGHIASALPYVGHALDGLRDGALGRVQFLAKGSLFLGRMTRMSDGMSMVVERNPQSAA